MRPTEEKIQSIPWICRLSVQAGQQPRAYLFAFGVIWRPAESLVRRFVVTIYANRYQRGGRLTVEAGHNDVRKGDGDFVLELFVLWRGALNMMFFTSTVRGDHQVATIYKVDPSWQFHVSIPGLQRQHVYEDITGVLSLAMMSAHKTTRKSRTRINGPMNTTRCTAGSWKLKDESCSP